MNPELGPYAFLPDTIGYAIDADRAVLAAAEKVSDAAYYQDFSISHGSLHKLLVHAMDSQWTWLNRFRGTSLTRIPDHTDFSTRESLMPRWPVVHRELRDFVARQTAETLAAEVTYQTTWGDAVTLPLGALMMHVADHCTYHCGQQNTLLKLAGGTPVKIFYYRWRLDHPL